MPTRRSAGTGDMPLVGTVVLWVLALSHCLILWSQTLLPCVPVMMYSSKEAQTTEPADMDWNLQDCELKQNFPFKVAYLRHYVTVIKRPNILILSYYHSKVMGGRVELSLRLHLCLASLLCCPAPKQGVSSTWSLLLTSQLTQHRSTLDSGLVSVVSL